jgi:DNA topoisomerase 2-associated protein PAT1
MGQGQPRALTLQEIEAEMLAQAARRRQQEQERQMEQLLLQQRQQQQIEEQRMLREQELRQRDLLLQQQQQQQQKDLHYQRILQMQQRQQAQIQQQQQLQGPQRTPPPRMLPGVSQSPRFMEHQRTQQALLLQEQERQQQILLQERERQHQRLLQDRDQRQVQQMLEQQHRIEELEKRLAHNLMLENKPGSPWQGLHDGPQFVGEQHLPVQRQFATPSPARHLLQQQQQAQFGHGLRDQQQVPQSLQMQQRLLAELAQHGMEVGGNQEHLRVEAMRKILEAEKMEEKRRRKAQKLAYMVGYTFVATESTLLTLQSRLATMIS